MKPPTIATCLLLFYLSFNVAAQWSGTTPTQSDSTDDNLSDTGLGERNSADGVKGYSPSTTNIANINSKSDSHIDDYESNDDDDDGGGDEEEYTKDNENGEDDDSTQQEVETTTDLLKDNEESSVPYDDLINGNTTLESSNLFSSISTSLSWLSEVTSTKLEKKDDISADGEALQTTQGKDLHDTSTQALRPSTGPVPSDRETNGARDKPKNLQAEIPESPKHQDAQSTQSPSDKGTSNLPAQPLLTTLGKGVTRTFATLVKSRSDKETEKKSTTPVTPDVRRPVNKDGRPAVEKATQVKPKKAKPMPLRSIESNLHVSVAAANQKSNKTTKANHNKAKSQNTNSSPGPPGPKGPPGPQGPPGPSGSPGPAGDCKCQDAGPTMSMQAAASAVLTKHFGPDKDVIVPFDLELTDLADNYDNTSGIFFCSIPGTYVISLYLMSHPGSKVNARIFVNSRPVAALWADDNKNAGFYPSSSIQTISRLEFGDQVYVMLVDGGYGDSWVHANYNVFTVFLLYEDMFQR